MQPTFTEKLIILSILHVIFPILYSIFPNPVKIESTIYKM